MIDIHSKHYNMHKNGIFYALIYINNHKISCIICMLSMSMVDPMPIDVETLMIYSGC